MPVRVPSPACLAVFPIVHCILEGVPCERYPTEVGASVLRVLGEATLEVHLNVGGVLVPAERFGVAIEVG